MQVENALKAHLGALVAAFCTIEHVCACTNVQGVFFFPRLPSPSAEPVDPTAKEENSVHAMLPKNIL